MRDHGRGRVPWALAHCLALAATLVSCSAPPDPAEQRRADMAISKLFLDLGSTVGDSAIALQKICYSKDSIAYRSTMRELREDWTEGAKKLREGIKSLDVKRIGGSKRAHDWHKKLIEQSNKTAAHLDDGDMCEAAREMRGLTTLYFQASLDLTE